MLWMPHVAINIEINLLLFSLFFMHSLLAYVTPSHGFWEGNNFGKKGKSWGKIRWYYAWFEMKTSKQGMSCQVPVFFVFVFGILIRFYYLPYFVIFMLSSWFSLSDFFNMLYHKCRFLVYHYECYHLHSQLTIATFSFVVQYPH